MITVKSIERDHVLRGIIGRDAAAWRVVGDDDEEGNDVGGGGGGWDEKQVLALYMLYHKTLDSRSDIKAYVDLYFSADLSTTLTTMDEETLDDKYPRERYGRLRRLVDEVNYDIERKYKHLVPRLAELYPEVFGRGIKKKKDKDKDKDKDDNNKDGGEQSEAAQEEWAYSYEQYREAYVILLSRYWSLELKDADEDQDQDTTSSRRVELERDDDDDERRDCETQQDGSKSCAEATDGDESDAAAAAAVSSSSSDDAASSSSAVSAITSSAPSSSSSSSSSSPVSHYHDFLAPFADLLNFGPPSTYATYDALSRRFEIRATRAHEEGEEVTFYYTSECEEHFLVFYGFGDGNVPKCEEEEV